MTELKDLFMLCESSQDEKELIAFDRTRFKANIKYDGERVMAMKKGDSVILFNRRGNIVTEKFSEVVSAVKNIQHDFIIDGEVISHDGIFNNLQRRALTKDKNKIAKLEKEIPVKFMAFDIIILDNKSLMNEDLEQRLMILSSIINDNEFLELVEYGEIDDMLNRVIEQNGEGIVIKDMKGNYENKRSKSWLKHKLFKEQVITITAFTDNPAGVRATDNEGNVVQVSGHHANTLKEVMQVRGYAEVNVQYLSKGKDGRMRFPSYRGIANEVSV